MQHLNKPESSINIEREQNFKSSNFEFEEMMLRAMNSMSKNSETSIEISLMKTNFES